jgi:carbon monoxide dehydrogenase subunit G
MKWVKRIGLGLVIFVALVVIIGFFLPSTYRVERSQTIAAKPEAVFATVNKLKSWPEWTAWTVARFPDMKIEFSGPESGTGASYSWSGKSSGTGKLQITKADANSLVIYDLDFENGKYISKGEIRIEPAGESVKVTWSNFGDLGGNPINRWFGLMMDRMMGPDFQAGLDNLKKKLEVK